MNKMNVAIVVAIEQNNGIGNNNKLVWNIPEDMKYFAKITKNSIVVMGRNTYFSIPEKHRPLKNRYNIVLTTQPEAYKHLENNHLEFCQDDDVVNILNRLETQYTQCFIIGGEQIYNQFFNVASKLYITRIDKSYDCDRFFPTFTDTFERTSVSEEFFSDSEKSSFFFEIYERYAS